MFNHDPVLIYYMYAHMFCTDISIIRKKNKTQNEHSCIEIPFEFYLKLNDCKHNYIYEKK